jgi:N4-(beta-N-acetylglucosaminyl)-L-asparaginase
MSVLSLQAVRWTVLLSAAVLGVASAQASHRDTVHEGRGRTGNRIDATKPTPSRPGARQPKAELPVVVNTWASAGFERATDAGFDVLMDRGTSLDAVVAACSFCERERCDGTVGYGGSPDETGETTLDAMVMDGGSMQVGAVGQLRGVRDAIRAARLVMEKTKHTLLVGESASKFATAMGLASSDLTTPVSAAKHAAWIAQQCQPNFWVDGSVEPDPAVSCGPYRPPAAGRNTSIERLPNTDPTWVRPDNHDTIAAVVVGSDGSIVSGTSTNGAGNKLHGRVGDSPIAGAGSYARAPDGGCGGTGDGDVMMRFLPCYQVSDTHLSNFLSEHTVVRYTRRQISHTRSGVSGCRVDGSRYESTRCCP